MRENPPPPEVRPAAGGEPALWAGLRRSALLEAALFFGVALAADFIFFDGTRYWNFAPHPFWLIVLLLSAQYGTNEGILTAVTASLVLLAGNLPEQSFAEDSYDYLFRVVREPVLWFAAAVVFGELRMRHVRERNRLRQELSDAEGREAVMASACRCLNQAKEALETRIAGQVRTAITLSQAAKAIEKLEPSEVLLGVANVVRAVMGAEKFSLYLLKRGSLEISIQEGWGADDRFSRAFGPDSLLFQQIVGRQRVLCVVNAEDERALAPEGILAGPLGDPEQGEVFGMLKIEQLGFLDLNFSNIHTFQFLCEWIATAYANSLRYQEVRSESVVSYETHLLSFGYFTRQTAFLAELAARIHFDLSMVVLQLDNPEELPEEDLRRLPAAIGETVAKVLRRSDLVFDYQRPGWEFAVVLPGTPVENVPIIVDKLVSGLKERLPDGSRPPSFSITIQALNRGEKPAVEGPLVLSQQSFQHQMQALASLARRQGFDLSLIVLRAEISGEQGEEEADWIPEAMSKVIREHLPEDAPAFLFQRSYHELAILLPAVSPRSAQALTEGIVKDLTRSHGSHASGKVHFSSTVQTVHSSRQLEASRV